MSRLFVMILTVPGIWLLMLSVLGACLDSNNSDSNSRSFFPLDVTILSTNGTNITPSMPIMHNHIPLATLQQRSLSTIAIRDCPEQDANISRSWCRRSISAQDFETFCREPHPVGQTSSPDYMYYTTSKCGPDEICVGSKEGDAYTPLQAHCVSTTHFVSIGQNSSSADGQNVGSYGTVTAGFNPAVHMRNGSQLAVEAVVTTGDKKSLIAKSMVMQAQNYNGLWRTVANGTNFCLGCTSVDLKPFPKTTTQRIKVDVVLPDTTPMGVLWLASYSYQ